MNYNHPADLVEHIRTMSYPDFVGIIGQTNVPPGSLSTVNEWSVFSKMDSESRVFEVACTTGFSSLNLARLTGCNAMGVDLASPAVTQANRNAQSLGLDHRVRFEVADATQFRPSFRPSHIVLGAALGFFDQPQSLLQNCFKIFETSGMLLTSPFYLHKPLSKDKVFKAQKVLGITPTLTSYKDTIRVYEGLEVLYESRKTIEKETDSEIDHYCKSTVQRALRLLPFQTSEIENAIYERLFEIRNVCNELRESQSYSVLVLRFDSQVFPHRFVELF